MHAHIARYALDRVVAQVAVAAGQLQATFEHFKAGFGHQPLGHGNMAALLPGKIEVRPIPTPRF